MNISEKSDGLMGLMSVVTIILVLLIFGFLNADFNFWEDYISMLGSKGEPNAFLFNLFGFVGVGFLLSIFGFFYGRLLNDRLLSILLSLFGLGFAFTALPVDLVVSDSPLSKAHIVAITLGLAFWFFGLSRLGYNSKLNIGIRKRANFTAVLLAAAMIGSAMGLWSMPVTHRIVFGIVFGWTAITSIELIRNSNRASEHTHQPPYS